MRKVRYKTLRVDMGGVWVSLLLLLYLAPGAPGLGDQNRPVTLHQLSLAAAHPPADAPVGMVSSLPESWRVRRTRLGGVRRLRRRTQSQYREDPEPEDYEDDDEEGSANQVNEDENDAPDEDRLLLEQHVRVDEDDDDEAPPDSTEMRERYRVSDHENPPEPATKPNYTGEGHWARPPAHVAQRMPFVPVQNYAQVRRYETELHLSPEDALSDAANEEEVKNAPRLREVVTHHRTQQVYSEEGYEDSAYDHGGYDKHGEHHELAPGWEMTAVRLLGRAAESPPDGGSGGGSGEEEGTEGDDEEEDGGDHNAEGSDPRAKAVAAPPANRTRHGASSEAQGTWRFQKVTTDNKNQVRVAEASGNFSKPTPLTPLENLVTSAKSKREGGGNLGNLTLKLITPEQLHVKSLLRALKLKEKERRLAQKRSKKWGREKKKNQLSRKLKKARTLTPDGYDVRDNEIKQPKSSKLKKLRKEQKRAKRMKASKIKVKRNKSLNGVGLFGDGKHVRPSTMRAIILSSGVQDLKGVANPLQLKKVENKTNSGTLVGQAEVTGIKRAQPLESVMKNPFSMYHRDPIGAMGPLASLGRNNLDRVLGPTSVGDVANSKIWGLVPPWGSYGNGRQLHSLHTDNPFRPLPTGLLASADSAEVASNDGLATVIQPFRNNMEGFFDRTGRMGVWGTEPEQNEEEMLESSSTNENPKPKFVLPGRGNAVRKFPKTEAILQMETRTLSKLRKTHNVKELPSNLKHVKPLIGVSSKSDKLSAKQIQMKDIGKRPQPHLGNDFTGRRRDSAILTTESLTDKTLVTTDRAVYIANLTENYLSAKNFSWPPQVTLLPLPETKQLGIPYVNNKAEKTSHRKTRRNARYQSQEKPFKNYSRGTVKFKRDNKSQRLLGLGIDERKYPFYLDTSSEDLPKYSPLRYAINPSEIPVKTGGGMEFYESREKYKRCKEVEPPEDPVPDRPSDGQWVQNTDGPDGPRISGLGEVINCLREKLFGTDPLDNPFFLETRIGLPADTSLAETKVNDGTPVLKTTDHFDFYRDILRQIDNTALKPFHADVPNSPYVYIGSKSTSGSEAQGSPAHYAAPRFHHFNINAKTPKPEYFTDMRLTEKQVLAAQLAPQDVTDYDEGPIRPESLRQAHIKGISRREPPVNQQNFVPPVPEQFTTVDPHTPLKLSENSKKYLDDVLDGLANLRESKKQLPGERSQTDAQETKMRIGHSHSVYQPVKARKMDPPPLTTFKYKSKYTDSLYPSIHLGPNSHERLLSWPKAKNVLRDVGAKQEVFETSETKDPIRSQIASPDPGETLHEQKKISGKSIIHSASFNFNQTQFTQEDEPFPHPSKTAEIFKQIEDAIKENQRTIEGTQASTSTQKPEVESTRKYIYEPAASVITPLSTSHTPRLPEPIYHAVRGVGGIKSYHVGIHDDSVIEIPTVKPEAGDKWRYKPKEQTEETELSAQQSDEGEQQASREPEPHEQHAPGDDSPYENQDGDDNGSDGNASNHNDDYRNAWGNKNEDDAGDNKNEDDAGDNKNEDDAGDNKNEDDAGDNKNEDDAGDNKNEDDAGDNKNEDDASDGKKDRDASDANKNDDNASDANKNDDNASDANKNDDNASDANKNDDNASDANKNDDNASDANKNDDNASDANKNDDNASDANKNDDNASDANKNDIDADHDDNDKQVEDDEAKPDNNEEAPENNEEEDDKSNNNGKPDFDDWFKESPYKVNDENDYNLDWDDSRPKFRVPFSKEWHKELGGINDEFKDDNDEDEVGKHVEQLFNDDKGHDAYPDINTEPPAAASGEGEQGDGNEAEKQEASDQEPQEEAAPPSEEGNAASPEKKEKDQGSATEEVKDDTKQDPKEDEGDSNAAEENVSPEEDNQKAKQRESTEPTSNEEPTSAEEPKEWKSGGSTRRAKKDPKEESAQEVPSEERGGIGNDDDYDPAGYEKPGDEHSPSGEAHSTEESQQSPKRAKAVDAFWSDKDDFGAPPGAKIRVVEHDASFGDMDDDDDDDDTISNGGKKVTRRGKTPDNLSITTTNSRVRSKGFDTGVNKRRATSHQNKARPVIEQIDTTSSGEDMDGDFATNLKIEFLPTVQVNTTLSRNLNITHVQEAIPVK